MTGFCFWSVCWLRVRLTNVFGWVGREVVNMQCKRGRESRTGTAISIQCKWYSYRA
jgi:hypothetical protein